MSSSYYKYLLESSKYVPTILGNLSRWYLNVTETNSGVIYELKLWSWKIPSLLSRTVNCYNSSKRSFILSLKRPTHFQTIGWSKRKWIVLEITRSEQIAVMISKERTLLRQLGYGKINCWIIDYVKAQTKLDIV